MAQTKDCRGDCGRKNLSLDSFPERADAPDGRRNQCNDCYRAYYRDRRAREGAGDDDALVAVVQEGGEVMASFGTSLERECGRALIVTGSIAGAAEVLGIAPRVVRAHLQELVRRSATRGYAPGTDMTKTTPDGFSVRGVSTLYDADGQVKGQWVKTVADKRDDLEMVLDAMSGFAERWKGCEDPITAPETSIDDLLCVYPMGDPHLGMLSWHEETGQNFDLQIAERNLYAAADKLVGLAPASREGLVINLGDMFHADSNRGETTRGTRVDVDSRWAKLLRVGVRVMKRIITRALEKHQIVRVIIVCGNHDSHTALMLAVALAEAYEREPRVVIDTSPDPFHWHRHGECLIGTTHGDTAKPDRLPGVMACDRAKDWGETTHRYWYVGHVHHDTVKEYPGVTVESFRTLAPRDAWHHSSGYRSGQDMKLDVLHRKWGRVARHVVGVSQLFQ